MPDSRLSDDWSARPRWLSPALLVVLFFIAGCAGGSGPGGALKNIESVEVCLNGECGPAADRFSKDELIGGMLAMLKANENTEAILCDNDPKTKECVRDDISFFVQGGPIPGVSTYGNLYLTHVGLDKKTFQIKYTMAATVTWIGTPVLCQDQYTEITVVSVDEILIETPSFACTWTIIPHVWNAKYSVGAIDFDNSVITGNYAISGAGLLVGGGGEGTFTMKFPNRHTLAFLSKDSETKKSTLRPVGQLPTQMLAAPAPKPEDVATSTGEFDPVERKLWETVSKNNKAAGYQDYLNRYPEGRFAGAARSKLQVAGELEAQNKELALWKKIKNSTEAAVFESYKAKYPKGLYVEVATIRARSLKAATAEAAELDAELALWEEVKGSTVIAEIQSYLNRYPNGQFAALAGGRIGKLGQAPTMFQDVEMSLWDKIRNSRDIMDYQNFLQAFPSGIYAGIAKGRIQNLNVLAEQTEELRFWNSVKNSKNQADYQKYLKRYPQGQFADLARTLSRQLTALDAERKELALWDDIKDSSKPGDFDVYLAQYPDGRFAIAAQDRKLKVEMEVAFADIDFGRFHALVIGNNKHAYLPDLVTAVNDAKAVGAVLEDLYGYKVTYLINADRKRIIDTLSDLRRSLTQRDNLLIYYAGHGQLDEEAGRGYWLPVDAEQRSPANWISTADITDTLKALQAKHVIVVADSCYSGTLVRSVKLDIKSAGYLRRMSNKKTRVALTSGGLEPVADDGGGGHSVFANAFLGILKENMGVIEGTRLFSKLRRPVMINAQQTPEYSDIRFAGHEGGDFLFVRR
ncbi:MAG: caspase family protein [Rhodospirillales bacterium]